VEVVEDERGLLAVEAVGVERGEVNTRDGLLEDAALAWVSPNR
jgi:hypothetical protein